MSTLIAAEGGVGRCFGSQPHSKVSMMIMRPPQHGHGCGSTRGSSIVASGVSGCFGRDGTASSSRAWAMFAARLVLTLNEVPYVVAFPAAIHPHEPIAAFIRRNYDQLGDGGAGARYIWRRKSEPNQRAE